MNVQYFRCVQVPKMLQLSYLQGATLASTVR